jgi:hypothetical protein
MLKKLGILVNVITISLFLLADDIKIISVSFGVFNEDNSRDIEIVRMDFSSVDFAFELDKTNPTNVKIKVNSALEGMRLINSSGKTAYTPPSQKVAGIFIEHPDERTIVLRVNLKSNYLVETEKSEKSLLIKILPDTQPVTTLESTETPQASSATDIESIRWDSRMQEGQDFFYRGFALATLNYASITGNSLSYSNGIFEFDRGFSSRQKLSFLGDGRIFGDYYLTVQAFYDPLDDSGFDYKPISNLYFYAKLENGLNYFSIGDHDKETFTNLFINRFTQSFLGAEAHLENEWGSATALAAISKGGSEIQEFQADNTTGPYQLSRTPIVIGSEFVTIEERDKNSTTRIVNTAVQTRGVDYFINYEEGEITFVTPVAKETFNRNPNYIVVRYQFEQIGAGNEYVSAAQMQVKPVSNMSVGATYINKFKDGGFDNRDEVFGLNAGYDGGEMLNAFAEVAYNNKVGANTDNGTAYYMQLQGKIGDKLRYRGSYQNIDSDFVNIANSRLRLYSNQSRIDTEALYSLNEYINFSMGYRSEESNIDHSEGNPSMTNSSLYGQWQMNYPDIPAFTIRYDIIDRYDDLAASERSIDFNSRELTVNAEKYINILGQTGLMAIYRNTSINDKTGSTGDGEVNLYGAKLINRPFNDIMIFAEYRLETGNVQGGSGYPVDYHILGAGGRVSPIMNLNVDVLFENRERTLKSSGEKESEEDLWSVGGAYVLSSSLQLNGRYEDRSLVDFINSSNTQKQKTANLRFFVNPLNNLRFGLGYEMENREISSLGNNRSYEDRLLIEGSYKRDKSIDIYARYQIDLNEEEFPPLPVTTAENNVNLLGLRFWIGDKFDFLGRYKTQKITGADNNTLSTITFEAGYQMFEEYKFILGFESAKFEHPTYLSENYNASNLYIRLVAAF